MGCGEGLARTLLFVANFAFVLVGIALLTLGVLGVISLNKVTEGIPDEVSTAGVFYFLVALGSIIFLIAFLGCCGSCKKHIFMINCYGTILVLLFLAQVGLGIYALVKIKDTTNLQQQIKSKVESLVTNYSSNKDAVDSIQQALQCCGANGPLDFGINIPTSCYQGNSTSNDLYSEGCAARISDLLISSTRILAIVVIAVSTVEVVGAVLAFGLAYCIRDRRAVY